MGTRYQFICPKCQYEAVVSGGDDIGMAGQTTTIGCDDCRELYDVVTSETPWEEPPDLDEESLVCPGSASWDDEEDDASEASNPDHRVRRWKDDGPCPKCGMSMSRGELVEHWD